jgi:YVTN family beta-propeller protein
MATNAWNKLYCRRFNFIQLTNQTQATLIIITKIKLKKMSQSNFKTKLFLTAISLALAFQSCKKDDPNPTPVEDTPAATTYTNGVFITCEGPFVSGTGTVSFYNRGTNSVSNDIFNKVNSAVLGNTVQSMELFNSKAYIVVNNANKIEVVNSTTMQSTGKITGLASPRYFVGIDANKGYVSQWGNATNNPGVQVVNLATNTVVSLIATGVGPDKMLKSGNFLYVVNSGGFGNDSTVSVINCTTDAVVATLPVGHNPNSIREDKNGKIWVLCGGIPDYVNPSNGTQGKLVKINPASMTIEASFTFTSHSEHPSNLAINKLKDKLFFLENFSSGSLFAFDINAATLPTSSIVSRNFYSIGIDPNTDQIFTSVTNYSNGWILRYSSNYAFIDSFEVGIIPGNYCFN